MTHFHSSMVCELSIQDRSVRYYNSKLPRTLISRSETIYNSTSRGDTVIIILYLDTFRLNYSSYIEYCPSIRNIGPESSVHMHNLQYRSGVLVSFFLNFGPESSVHMHNFHIIIHRTGK